MTLTSTVVEEKVINFLAHHLLEYDSLQHYIVTGVYILPYMRPNGTGRKLTDLLIQEGN